MIGVILRRNVICVFCVLDLHAGPQGSGGARSSGPVITGKIYVFEKIADGVYYATSTSPMATGGNHPIIVGEHDVFIVDVVSTPADWLALL